MLTFLWIEQKIFKNNDENRFSIEMDEWKTYLFFITARGTIPWNDEELHEW